MRRRDVDRYELERTFAPHVDPAWTEAARSSCGCWSRVTGSAPRWPRPTPYCVDSDQDAAEAFGDPVAYARSLELPAEADPTRARSWAP